MIRLGTDAQRSSSYLIQTRDVVSGCEIVIVIVKRYRTS